MFCKRVEIYQQELKRLRKTRVRVLGLEIELTDDAGQTLCMLIEAESDIAKRLIALGEKAA